MGLTGTYYDYTKLPPATGSATSGEAPLARDALMLEEVEDDSDRAEAGSPMRRDVVPPLPSSSAVPPSAATDKSQPDALNGSGSATTNVLSLRRPATARDVLWLLLFLSHLLLLALVLPAAAAVSSPSSSSWGSGKLWRGVLMTTTFVSCGAAAALLHLMLLRPSARRSVIIWAGRVCSVLLLSLSVALLLVRRGAVEGGSFIELVVAALVAWWGVSEWRWDRRMREQREFAVVMADMATDELLSSSQPLCLAAYAALGLQAVLVLWWSSLAGLGLGSSGSGVTAVTVGALLLLDLYWVTQVCRKALAVVVSGMVVRWFYSCNDDDEEAGGVEEEEHDEAELLGAGPITGGLVAMGPRGGFMALAQEDVSLDDATTSDHAPARRPPAPSSSAASTALKKMMSQLTAPPKKRKGDASAAVASGPSAASTKLASTEVLLHHLHCAITVSLGTISRAALLSPPAQLLWSIKAYDTTHHQNGAVHRFIRGHHALSLVHVGAYKKALGSAARDVWNLILSSGLDLVLRGDTLHRSLRCVSSAAAASSVLLVLLLWPSALRSLTALPRLLLLAMTFTATYAQVSISLEAVSSTVTACHVVFAESPNLLSQTFPLIFHRLIRTAELRHF